MTDSRRFSVQAQHSSHRHLIEEASFEAAAVAFVETLHDLPDGDEAISIVVRDLESGHAHCFTVDLDSGETSPCG